MIGLLQVILKFTHFEWVAEGSKPPVDGWRIPCQGRSFISPTLGHRKSMGVKKPRLSGAGLSATGGVLST
ncbi:hypothetical protein [Nitrosomonas communis]|uniref:hypothetical protein n=1 Tax=Nitrosomonas communis TaxID=44574 RepID=UPI003D26B229